MTVCTVNTDKAIYKNYWIQNSLQGCIYLSVKGMYFKEARAILSMDCKTLLTQTRQVIQTLFNTLYMTWHIKLHTILLISVKSSKLIQKWCFLCLRKSLSQRHFLSWNQLQYCYNYQVNTKIGTLNVQKYKILITEMLFKHFARTNENTT